MGHEAIVYGRIDGAYLRGERFSVAHELNRQVITELPEKDEWPWLIRGMFALPASFPYGSYRTQVIHLGASFKDDPMDRTIWEVWLSKFEDVLRRMYWWSAVVHLETEFEASRVFRWTPTDDAVSGLREDPPRPITSWTRVDQIASS